MAFIVTVFCTRNLLHDSTSLSYKNKEWWAWMNEYHLMLNGQIYEEYIASDT
jgi:hypothetical protein